MTEKKTRAKRQTAPKASPEKLELNPKGIYAIEGVNSANLKAGVVYKVSGETAARLINKGVAKLV